MSAVTVRHFVWRRFIEDSEVPDTGRVATRLDLNAGRIRFARVCGKMPPANLTTWYAAFESAFWDFDLYARESAKSVIHHPYWVEERRRGAGGRAYLLRELIDAEVYDAPIREQLLITPTWNIESFDMHLGHFYLITKSIMEHEKTRSCFSGVPVIEIIHFEPHPGAVWQTLE